MSTGQGMATRPPDAENHFSHAPDGTRAQTIRAGAHRLRAQGKARGYRRAFTLIELLIVIAILGILALIAIPNFMAAQTRAKVSRSLADMRTVATAVESYCVDTSSYPPDDGQYNTIPACVTTPVAYLTAKNLLDPFAEKLWHRGLLPGDASYGEAIRWYGYFRIIPQTTPLPVPPPARESVDGPAYNKGALRKYGHWRLVGRGPDLWYSGYEQYTQTGELAAWMRFIADYPLFGADVPYDPSNGSISWGNLLRTQRETEGLIRN